MLGQPQPYLLNLKNLQNEDIELVGKEAIQNSFLHKQNIPTPPAFVVTSRAFDDFLTATQLVEPIMELISKIDLNNYIENSKSIQRLIVQTKMPSILERPIVEAYKNLSSGNLPFVSMEISNILPKNFIVETLHHHHSLNIYGVDEFIRGLQECWADLFSPEAIKLRMDNDYEGILTTAVIVQKMIRPEISGTVYLENENNHEYMYVTAMYGFEAVESQKTFPKDLYKIDLDNLQVLERTLLQQTEMLVRKGKLKEGEKTDMIVKISPEWQSRQKLDDERAIKLVELTLKINEILKINVETSWGIEAGEINIFSIHESHKTYKKGNHKIQNKEIILNPKETPDEIIEIPVQKKNSEEDKKPQIENAEGPLATSQELRKELSLEKSNELQNSVEPALPNLLTQIVVNSGNMLSETLTEVIRWGRAYVNGNDLILNNQILPEHVTAQKDILSYISNLSLQISNVMRLLNDGDLIYSLSSIDQNILKLLNITQNSLNKFLDERLIANEGALMIEIAAIKKARNDSKHKNISLIISGVRNYSNLLRIKRIISGEGLRRSPSFKMLVELSIAGLFFELDKLDTDDVDGIVVNIDKLLQNSFLKDQFSFEDYASLLESLKQVKQICKQKKLSFSLKLDTKPDKKMFKEMLLLQPSSIIINFKLEPIDIEFLENTEKEFFEKMLIPLKKRGRKTKKLF